MCNYDNFVRLKCDEFKFQTDCPEYDYFLFIVNYYMNSEVGTYSARKVCDIHKVYEILASKFGVSSYTIRHNLSAWCYRSNEARNDGNTLSVAQWTKRICHGIKAQEV